MGRPTKYRIKFCDRIVEIMKDGASKIEVCADLDISFETLTQWTDEGSSYYKKDFSEAIKKGQLLSQAWWESQGRTNLKETKFNYTGWFMNVKNRFGKSPVPWSDKQQLDVNAKHSHTNETSEEISNKIKAIVDKLNANSTKNTK